MYLGGGLQNITTTHARKAISDLAQGGIVAVYLQSDRSNIKVGNVVIFCYGFVMFYFPQNNKIINVVFPASRES